MADPCDYLSMFSIVDPTRTGKTGQRQDRQSVRQTTGQQVQTYGLRGWQDPATGEARGRGRSNYGARDWFLKYCSNGEIIAKKG